jgi:hypothetical protein
MGQIWAGGAARATDWGDQGTLDLERGGGGGGGGQGIRVSAGSRWRRREPGPDAEGEEGRSGAARGGEALLYCWCGRCDLFTVVPLTP